MHRDQKEGHCPHNWAHAGRRCAPLACMQDAPGCGEPRSTINSAQAKREGRGADCTGTVLTAGEPWGSLEDRSA